MKIGDSGKQYISIIWDWLAISDKLEKADLIFLFGGATMDIVDKGFELINCHYAPVILTSGNNGTFGNPKWTKPSADIFRDYLVKKGINKNRIIVQNKSTNTLEDVTYSVPLLLKTKLLPKKIILVSCPVHQRRAYATFKKQFPYRVQIINQPCHEKNPIQMDDKELKETGIRCLQEYDRLIMYAEKGDIEKQTIPHEVTQIVKKLRYIV